jgi:plasmid stabilization system protein ParE
VKYSVSFSPDADHQFTEILAWLAGNAGPDVAQLFIDDFEKLRDLLEETPLFRPVHDVLLYRHASVGRFEYTVWYQVIEERVEIACFAHGRMNLSTVRQRIDGGRS